MGRRMEPFRITLLGALLLTCSGLVAGDSQASDQRANDRPDARIKEDLVFILNLNLGMPTQKIIDRFGQPWSGWCGLHKGMCFRLWGQEYDRLSIQSQDAKLTYLEINLSSIAEPSEVLPEQLDVILIRPKQAGDFITREWRMADPPTGRIWVFDADKLSWFFLIDPWEDPKPRLPWRRVLQDKLWLSLINS